MGWFRLTHPFPSILDGLVSGGVTLLAGGAADVALRIGVAMTMLQLGIGTVNDLVDAPRDAGRKPGKPLPASLVDPRAAKALAVAVLAAGIALAVGVSPALGLLGLAVVAIGLVYDLWLKGTAWSWLPFAVGIPVLPLFGWVGSGEPLPASFAVLLPVAVLAGAALAIGNSLVDVERDRAAGVTSIAASLGSARASVVTVGLLVLIWTVAVASMIGRSSAGPVLAVAAAGAVPVAASFGGRSAIASRRERAWRVEAVGLAILAAIWLALELPPAAG